MIVLETADNAEMPMKQFQKNVLWFTVVTAFNLCSVISCAVYVYCSGSNTVAVLWFIATCIFGTIMLKANPFRSRSKGAGLDESTEAGKGTGTGHI